MTTIDTTQNVDPAAVERALAGVEKRAEGGGPVYYPTDLDLLDKRVSELEEKLNPPPKPKPNLAPPKHWNFKALRKDVDLSRILREAEQEGARGIVIDLPGVVLMGLEIACFEPEYQIDRQHEYLDEFRDEYPSELGPVDSAWSAAEQASADYYESPRAGLDR